MKKITLAMSVLLTAGAWCGLAYADDTTVTTPEEPQTITMNFQETQYGAPLESDNAANYLPDGFTITDGKVQVKFDKKYTGYEGTLTCNGARFWSPGQLRVYTRSMTTISVPGGKITSVEMNGTAMQNVVVVSPETGANWTVVTKNSNKTATFTPTATEGAESLSFRATGTVNINNIKVTYVGGEITTKSADIKLASDNVEIAVGETYAIDVTKATTAEVSYAASVNKVATVDENGVITAVGLGTTNILAFAPANDEFTYGYATCKVTVLPEGTFSYSALGEEYTFENPEEIAVWTHDASFGLKGSAHNGAANAAEAMAISEPVSMPAHRDITLTFQQATNFVPGVTTETFGNYFKMYVREVAEEGGDGGFGGFDDGGIALMDDQTPVEGEGGEETEEPAWVEVPGATVPQSVNSDWTFRAQSVNMTEFAGKKIQIGFKYISTAEVCSTWEIKEITFVAVDPLAAEKKAAIAEITTYMNQLSGDQSWNLENRIGQIEDCYTTEDIDGVVAQTKEWIIDNVIYGMASTYFVWNVGEKVAGYVAPAEGVSPWIAGNFGLNSLWIAEMVAEDGGEGGIAPAADEVETEPETPATEPSEYAIRIKNATSGLYVAAPGEAGTIIGSTDKAEEAGVYVVACIEGKIALVADANNAVTVNWDAEKGMVSGTTYETISCDEAEMWDNLEEPVLAAVTGATSEGEWMPTYATEISEFTISVPSEAKLSGLGEISFYTEEFDPITYTQNRTVIASWSAAAVEAMTPVEEEITIKVLKEVDGEWKEVEVTENYKKYTFTLRNVQTLPGDYVAYASEFMWYMEKDGEYTFSNPGNKMVTIEASAEGMALNVTPAEGTVTAIDKINIAGADPEMVFTVYYSGAFDAKVTLTKGETEIKSWTKDEVAAAQLHADDWSLPVEYELAAGVTEAGTYTLTIPAEFFENDNMETNNEIVIVWTIEEGQEDSISEISLGGAAVKVYDLQGRQLSAPVKGAINIINGKKVLVK